MSNHYDWKNSAQTCPSCGWTGLGSLADIGETFRDGAEYHCPKCNHRFGFIAYPLLKESISDPRAPQSDRQFAELALRGVTPAPSQPEISISGQRVFEDADYLLLKAKWFLGISHPFLAPFYVYLKSRNTFVKATSAEKRFLLAIVGEMARLGLSPQRIKATPVFRDFCAAVQIRGGALWQLFFNRSKAKDLANTYAKA